MTTRRTTGENPERLRDRATTGDPTLDRAARLLRLLQAPPRLHPAVEARIDRRLAGLPAPARRRALWPVLVSGVALLFAGTALAARYNPGPLRRLLAIIRPAPPPPAPLAQRPPSPPAQRPAQLPAPAETPPAIETPRPQPAPRAVAPVRRHARASVTDDLPEKPGAPEAPRSALADESALLGRALVQLRRDNNPGAALATLDEYEARFRGGVMGLEALAARVEALVKLGRTDQALARLDGIGPASLVKSPALRVLRGELRAGAGRLEAAIADFDVELDQGVSRGDLSERALYGRGSSRARRQDVAGARADLERYLQLFPHGRFAAEARQILGR